MDIVTLTTSPWSRGMNAWSALATPVAYLADQPLLPARSVAAAP